MKNIEEHKISVKLFALNRQRIQENSSAQTQLLDEQIAITPLVRRLFSGIKTQTNFVHVQS